jgi:hypothetical protein
VGEETLQPPRACNTTYNSWHHSEINAWGSLRIRKQPMKDAVEWRVNIMAGLRMTGTSLVFVFTCFLKIS